MTREKRRAITIALVKKKLKERKSQLIEDFYLHQDYRNQPVSGGLGSVLRNPALDKGVVHSRGNNN